MPLDIWLKSDDIDRNNKTCVRREMGTAVRPSHPLNIKQFPFFQGLCVWNSSPWAVPVKLVQPCAWTCVGTFLTDIFCSVCLLSQAGGRGWLSSCQDYYSSQLWCLWPGGCWVCTSLFGRKPMDVLWASQGEVMAGLGTELQQFGLRTCSLPTLAGSCFSSDRKTTWKKAVCKFCKSFFRGMCWWS